MTYETSTPFKISVLYNTALFEALPGSCILLQNNAPHFTVLAATPAYLAQTGYKQEAIIGKGIFEVSPPNPDDATDTGANDLQFSLAHVLSTKEPHQLPTQRYDIAGVKGSFLKRYWRASNKPILSPDGEVAYIIHSAEDITEQIEQKIAQQELETALEQARLSKEAAELGTFDMDLQKGTMHWDDRCRTVFGISHQGPVTYEKDFVEGLHPDDRERILKVVENALIKSVSNGDYDVEYRTIGAEDGVIRWIRAKGKVYFNDQEKPLRFIGSVLDITPQVSARKDIAESEAKYRTLFESMDQGFCILEMIFDDKGRAVDYRFLETNPVFEKQTGLKDAAGKPVSQLVPDLESHWFETYGKVALTGESIRFSEGSEVMGRMFDVYAFRVGDADSRKVALLFTDITERKKSEEALRQSELNLRNMILQSPIAMCILRGENFVVEIANDRMYELWGRGKEELEHRSIFEGLPEAAKQGYEELLTGVYTTGKTFSAFGVPVKLPREEGIQTVFVNLLYEAFREANGSISGIMVVATDVTEQVLARQKIEEVVEQRTNELAQANKTLQQTNTELQRSNQNLEEFAHAASHDLKEPVRKIHFFTERLKEQLSTHLKEGELRSFNRIENASKRMGSLIDDLLLYSHVSQRPHETEAVDLNEKLQRVLEDLELDIEEKGALIKVGKLPMVKGYSRQLQQLLQNLISNAVKYSSTNKVPHIDISSATVTENEKAYHLISVKDNGIGFEPEYADKIFQMFTRLHGKAEYSGTGVGLSIVKKSS